MKHAYILAAFAAALTAAPAQAQPVAADLLPAYEVATIVTSMGMRPVGRPAWLAGRYVIAAIDRHGREVNVVLDAFDGQVIAVRPLGRNSFGLPRPPGYPQRGAPYDPMDGRAPPPAVGPGAPPPPDDGEFFDNDQQQGSLPAPRPAARTSPSPRDPAVTGSVPRSAPAERKNAASKDAAPKASTPMPRPRPALAKANDPGDAPAKPEVAATPDQAKPASARDAAAKDAAAKPDAAKPAAAKPAAAKPDTAAKPAEAQAKAEAKPEVASKPEAGRRDIRVINLSKPKDAKKPEDKPGEAIRF